MNKERTIGFSHKLAIYSRKRLSQPGALSALELEKDVKEHLHRRKPATTSNRYCLGYKVMGKHHTYIISPSSTKKETIFVRTII